MVHRCAFAAARYDASMSAHHHMHLDAQPFAQIASGEKKVELRVADPKRRRLKVGDIIEFQARADSGKTLRVRVTELQHAASFESLVKLFQPAQLGVDGLALQALVLRLNRAYGDEVQEFGCIGIGFSLLSAS